MTKYKIIAVNSKFHPQFHLYLKITFFGITSYLFISHYITLVISEWNVKITINYNVSW